MPMVPGSNLGGGGAFFLILHKYLLSKVRGSNPGRDISFFAQKFVFSFATHPVQSNIYSILIN